MEKIIVSARRFLLGEPSTIIFSGLRAIHGIHIYNVFYGFLVSADYIIKGKDLITITHGKELTSKKFNGEQNFKHSIELIGFLCDGLFGAQYFWRYKFKIYRHMFIYRRR